jgi:hypothetical protein
VGGTTQREVVWERCEREGKENEEVMRGPAARRGRIGRSQFELVMGGGVLSLGLAAGGPLQTLKRERGTEKRPVDNGITSHTHARAHTSHTHRNREAQRGGERDRD